jgi:hypothetical protein
VIRYRHGETVVFVFCHNVSCKIEGAYLSTGAPGRSITRNVVKRAAEAAGIEPQTIGGAWLAAR